MKKCLLIFLSILSIGALKGFSQTTVFTDDFNRASLSPGGTPAMTYTSTLGTGASAAIVSSSYLNIVPGSANGVSYVIGTTATFSSPYSTTLSGNPGVVTWTFNFRWNRASSNNPAAPASGSYGQAIVLASSGASFTTGTTGYAIVYGNTSAPDPIRLVKFSNGVTGTLTNVISSGVSDIANTNNYVSVKVTYDPATNTWALFIRDDGASAWADPSSGVTTQKGSNTVDNTYTGSVLSNFGFLWSHATAATNIGEFDNFTVTVGSGGGGGSPVNYYSNSSGDLDAEATWNTNTSGTGGTALTVGGFTAGNAILNIRNGNPGNINAATWTVSGSGSKVVVDGTDLTIPVTKTITATVDVNAGRALKIQTATLPTLGTLAAGSTIEFNQSTATAIPVVSYSNLKLSGAGTKTFGGGTTVVTGALTLDGQSSGTLTIDASAGPTFTTISLGGDLTYLGTVVNPVDANSMTLSSASATTQTITANGNTVRFFRIASGTTGNNIILSTTGGSSNALLGNATSGGLTLNTGTTFDINGNTITFFAGGASMLPNTNAGLLKGSSTSSIVINKTTSGFWGNLNFVAGFENLKDLTINHTGASAATVSVGTSFNLYGTLTMTAGQLTLADKNITLVSNASGTATVAASAVASPFFYSTGKFILQRYIPGGKRAFRFLGNPFNSAINLSELTDNIIITGAPGTGFTTSGTNNPSAFWYDVATGNENATNDIGWTAFTTTDGTGSNNTWKQYQGIRVLVRGSIADGLSPVTPSAVTIDAGGVLNAGTQVINVNNGVNSGYNFIANPFASNINLTTIGGNVSIGGSLTTNYYVWDMTLGTRGGWVNPAFSSSYVLPSFSGFIVKTAALSNVTITENAKTSAAATGTLYRNNNANTEMVRLSVTASNINWDRFELYYDASSKVADDRNDGTKFLNSEVNLYSIQASKNYSIDSRPFVKDDIIPLGFTSALQQTYTIKASEYSLPADVELYLRDKFLGTETKLTEGAAYTFSVTANAASQGNERFELVQKMVPALPTLTAASFSIKLSPNPTTDMVKVAFSNVEYAATTITITNAEGKSVKRIDAGNVQAGQLSIPVKGLAKGTYYVTLSNGTESKTEKLQIQ
jgi:hypothetical protein